jgi:hypothetical protein
MTDSGRGAVGNRILNWREHSGTPTSILSAIHSPFLIFLVYNIPCLTALPMRQALDARLAHVRTFFPSTLVPVEFNPNEAWSHHFRGKKGTTKPFWRKRAPHRIFSRATAGVSGISDEISDSSTARTLNLFGGDSGSVDPRLSEPA